MELPITHPLLLTANELHKYGIKIPTDKTTALIKGVFSIPHFKGNFDGYTKSSFDVKSVQIKGATKLPEPLKKYLKKKMLNLLLPAYLENDEC